MPFNIKHSITHYLHSQKHIAPLAVLRVFFGGIMLFSTLRFIAKGWVSAYYIQSKFHFTFYGFDWVHPLGTVGMYSLFAVLALAALFVMIGLFYRLAIVAYFLCFTYVELIDVTTYLNHYYFVSIMAFLLILVPANRYFSVDVCRNPRLQATHIPAWCIDIFKLQLLLVYLFAGISKLSYDWLIAAMPLRIWLPANNYLPIIGGLMTKLWVAYVFSWFGALFDLFIGFMLFSGKTRKIAYALVVIFHLATGWFFKIGMFPYIMILVTVVFFSAKTHLRIIRLLRKLLPKKAEILPAKSYTPAAGVARLIYVVLIVHFVVQLVLPFRFALYPGKLYWTEEGYRFSWRVMLMEKGGTAFFYVKDPLTGRKAEVVNSQYLTAFQENMMATQPDMILQFAHFLAKEYQKKGVKNPEVTTECYVTLNGSGSKLYIDSNVNLANIQETFAPRKWVLPFNHK